jgi:hypothetical protein
VAQQTTLGADFARAFADKDSGRCGSSFTRRSTVEQQAYLSTRDGQIDWMRVVCSGFRPAT